MSAVRRIARQVAHLWPVAALLLAWDGWILINGFTATVAPRPWSAIGDVVSHPAAYLPDALATLSVASVGLLAGGAAGLIAAIGVWSSAAISGLVTPASIIMRAVPLSALVPVIALMIGYGDATVVTITAIICFFPIFVTTLSGLAQAAPGSIAVFHTFGASWLTALTRLYIPSAVPNIMVGIRIGAPDAILGAMLAELLVGQRGLGHLFSQAQSYSDSSRLWGTALVAAALSVVVFLIARSLEQLVRARMA